MVMGWPKGVPRGPQSAEHRERNRQATLTAYARDPTYRLRVSRSLRGKKQSPEVLAQKSSLMKARSSNPEWLKKHKIAALKGWANNPQRREAARERMRKQREDPLMRQRLSWPKGRPRSSEQGRKARLHQKFPKKMTDIERSLHHEFKKRRLKFEMHKTMFSRWQPDFVFENVRLIVQADGDYWHRILEGVAEKDARFNAAARADGWTVWRFAESEIKQHPEACGRAVARFMRSH